MTTARVRQNGQRVQLVIDGRVTEMPWQAALDIARALLAKARLAEAEAAADRIIADSALLHRAGAPFGLAPTPRHLRAAVQAAAWDRSLRRYLPGGVRSAAVVGAPAILQFPGPGAKR